MPIVKVHVPEDALTPQQRREIVQGLHEVLLTVEKRPLNSPTYVLIDEVPACDWGFTGKVQAP
jgi:4-oxalocrotonate tautomerase family enzyme